MSDAKIARRILQVVRDQLKAVEDAPSRDHAVYAALDGAELVDVALKLLGDDE